MSRKLPLVPTILVGLAVAVMIGLGIWQLERRKEKEALLATYARCREPAADRLAVGAAQGAAAAVPLGHRQLPVGGRLPDRGRPEPAAASPGYLIIADCRTGAEGPGVAVELGWSKNPNAGRAYRGGLVSGVIAPDRVSRMRLVAATPGPGLIGQRTAVARQHPQQSSELCHPMVPVRRDRGGHLHARAALARAEAEGDDAWLS